MSKFAEHEKFIKNQEILSGYRPQAKLATFAQNVAGLGVLSAFYNPGMGIKSAGLAGMFSPGVHANLYKAIQPKLKYLADFESRMPEASGVANKLKNIIVGKILTEKEN
jgi:hypothetical protein